MPKFKESNLRFLAQNELRYFSEKSEAVLNESERYLPHFDIFLSHSYLDKSIIKGLFIALSKMGYSVYVDWIIDSGLSRSSVNKTTADKIKKRMKQSETLFYATSVNTKQSNWMPWETGYMDSLRDKCAIVEIELDEPSTFETQEYLLLYPFVTNEKINTKQAIYINNRDTKNRIPFSYWKTGLKP